MRLHEMDFSKYQPVRKQVTIYAKDGNTVVRPYRELYPITALESAVSLCSDFYLEVITFEYSSPMYMVYEDIEGFCHRLGHVEDNQEIAEMCNVLNKLPYINKDGYLAKLEQRMEKGGFINLIDLAFCRHICRPELEQKYRNYREEYLKKEEAKYQAEREAREAAERKEKEEKKRVYENIIQEAVRALYNREAISNDPLEDGNTLVLHLMKHFGIQVPLRTQGWINERLAKIIYADGTITYSYYKSGKDSGVFYKYLTELDHRIRSSFSVGICPVCGNAEIKETDLFCRICGNRLKEA